MRQKIKILLAIIVLSFSLQIASAQEVIGLKDAISVYFRVGKHNYDPSYMGNKKRMDDLIKQINNINSENSPFYLIEVDFEAAASPEGRLSSNEKLAHRRAETINQYIRSHAEISDSILTVEHFGEAWEGLVEMVRKSDKEWKDDVLEIIETYPLTSTDADGRTIELRKNKLIAYDGGCPWRWMLKNWFPTLRHFTVVLKVGVDPLPMEEIAFEELPYIKDEIVIRDSLPTLELLPIWRPELTLKTNGIGWGLGHANVAAELDIAPHWAVSVPFYYSGGIDYFKSTLKFRGIVLQPEIRYYLKGNDGFYLGAHFGLGWYNFALGGEYRIQDHKGRRPAYGGGIGAGYSMQFKTAPHWGMEFALGAGVYDALYDVFYNEPNGAYAERGVRKTFVGVDNASVSVTYKFGKAKKEVRK